VSRVTILAMPIEHHVDRVESFELSDGTGNEGRANEGRRAGATIMWELRGSGRDRDACEEEFVERPPCSEQDPPRISNPDNFPR